MVELEREIANVDKKPRIGAEPSDSQAFLEITEALFSSFVIIAFEAKVGSYRNVPGSIRRPVASDFRKENNLLGERFILFEESFVREGRNSPLSSYDPQPYPKIRRYPPSPVTQSNSG